MCLVVQMGGSDLEGMSIDVDAEFVLYKRLIRIEAFEVIGLLLLLTFVEDFLHELFRFAFSLNECEDVVYVVGNYIPFVDEVYLFLFCFFSKLYVPFYSETKCTFEYLFSSLIQS